MGEKSKLKCLPRFRDRGHWDFNLYLYPANLRYFSSSASGKTARTLSNIYVCKVKILSCK